jgi:hypothetical protein
MISKKGKRVVVAKMATQKELDAGMKIASSAIVNVEWLDACAHMAVEEIDQKKLSELLCPTQTIGKIVAQDKQVICVASNISAANGLDLIAILIKWIKQIVIMETQ